MIDSVSTPGLPRGPSTSVMTPSPRSSGLGKRSISTTTLSFGLGPLGAGIADEDAVAEDGAVDADVALAVALEVGADELARGPFEDLDDGAGRLAVARSRLAAYADQDLVAGGGVGGWLLRG